ncbi:hypothetical protein L2E82_17307 [Cichorium intybus]|uniref:Uncharacterized protein n=1 Tax=Cichorium intybus TaxID=13427 RepID=A0ACB9F7I8_CICIN|nr:hypothetical protein L2E82_17307 [Cichorium intybus]
MNLDRLWFGSPPDLVRDESRSGVFLHICTFSYILSKQTLLDYFFRSGNISCWFVSFYLSYSTICRPSLCISPNMSFNPKAISRNIATRPSSISSLLRILVDLKQEMYMMLIIIRLHKRSHFCFMGLLESILGTCWSRHSLKTWKQVH